MPFSWRELHDGRRAAIWAGQSPHLLALGGSLDAGSVVYLLGLGGGYYKEAFGGADVHPLNDAVVMEYHGGEEGLHTIYAVEQHGDVHPKMHGAAKVCLPDGSFLFFGGGNPTESCNATSRLVVHPALRQRCPNTSIVHSLLTQSTEGSCWTVVDHPDGSKSLIPPDPEKTALRWERVATSGSQEPSPRHGLHACVHPESSDVIIFAGRGDADSSGCQNDLWALGDLQGNKGRWKQLIAQGQPPPPKVWYGATVTTANNWVICGGSQWQFEEDSNMDKGVVYVLSLRGALRWSTLRPSSPSPLPDLVVACAVVENENGLLVFGGCMPHRLASTPRSDNSNVFELCNRWYVPLTQLWQFDVNSSRWDVQEASATEVPEYGDTMLRSHTAALSVPSPEGSRVLVFGGSRYFTGAYFHDLLELHAVSESEATQQRADATQLAQSSASATTPAVLPQTRNRSMWQRFLSGVRGGGSPVTSAPAPAVAPAPPGNGSRGTYGRLNAMLRDGSLDLRQQV